jgi:hypothetical protein
MTEGDPNDRDDPIGTHGDLRRQPSIGAPDRTEAAMPMARRVWSSVPRFAFLLTAAIGVGFAVIGIYTVVRWLT